MPGTRSAGICGRLSISRGAPRLELDIVLLFVEELCVQACDLCEIFEGFDGAVVCAVFDECFGFGWFEGKAGFNLFCRSSVDVDGLAEVAGEVVDYGFDFFFGAFGASGNHVIYG